MSARKEALRSHMELRHAASWPVLEGLDESDMAVKVYSALETMNVDPAS